MASVLYTRGGDGAGGGGGGSKPCDGPYQLSVNRGEEGGGVNIQILSWISNLYLCYVQHLRWFLFRLSPVLLGNLSQYKMDLADPNRGNILIRITDKKI
jgi:hypothetical protein